MSKNFIYFDLNKDYGKKKGGEMMAGIKMLKLKRISKTEFIASLIYQDENDLQEIPLQYYNVEEDEYENETFITLSTLLRAVIQKLFKDISGCDIRILVDYEVTENKTWKIVILVEYRGFSKKIELNQTVRTYEPEIREIIENEGKEKLEKIIQETVLKINEFIKSIDKKLEEEEYIINLPLEF